MESEDSVASSNFSQQFSKDSGKQLAISGFNFSFMVTDTSLHRRNQRMYAIFSANLCVETAALWG